MKEVFKLKKNVYYTMDYLNSSNYLTPDNHKIIETLINLPEDAVVELVVTIPEKPKVNIYCINDNNNVGRVNLSTFDNLEYLAEDYLQTYYKHKQTGIIVFTVKAEQED